MSRYQVTFNNTKFVFNIEEGESLDFINYICSYITDSPDGEHNEFFKFLFEEELAKITIVKMYPLERFN